MASFIPFSIDEIGGRTVVRWIESGAGTASMPFFAQLVRQRLAAGARRRITGLDALYTSQGPDPVGLVMHLSRCGSTLLMQSLAHAGCIAPISEATPVNQLLGRSDIPEPERALLLRGLIRALGRPNTTANQLPSLVKFTSWNVLFFDIVRAAFPDLPWLFVYREPLEALMSHQRRPAGWLSNDALFAALTLGHRLPSLAGLDRERRGAAALAAYGEAALAASPTALNLINYSQLPAALLVDVPARFGLHTSTLQQGQIADASRIYSKDGSRSRVFDLASERRADRVTESLRDADRRHTRPVYAALERLRLGQ
jgi:hypothetical protein